MRNWGAIVRERLTRWAGARPTPVLVEELAAHLAQIYEDARDDGQSDAEAAAAALRVLDAPELFRQTIDARRPTVTDHVSAMEPAGAGAGSERIVDVCAQRLARCPPRAAHAAARARLQPDRRS